VSVVTFGFAQGRLYGTRFKFSTFPPELNAPGIIGRPSGAITRVAGGMSEDVRDRLEKKRNLSG
jgi:hypothetical protein